ncbi:tannase/feruloyl esterase family alpha/beta hydrolase [Roseateles terrae]|uniref:Feruloyl esterase n=1 Tax=Roseateles terrae TaxID=431060 RepID=A0ABR6GMK8_9BURK|nr:tannase/feruloyl esterase family alpha/beta hydrolase [Roseateles terrae]MBB3193312.1 feruloyl esterase [Roseateles terrae]
MNAKPSISFGPTRRQRPSRWRALLWWALMAWAAFVLMAAMPSLAVAAERPVAQGQALPIITPIADCSALGSTSLVDIGGAGSRVLKTSKATSQGLPACIVEGLLAPSIQFRVELPLGSWTQRYLQVGCGGLCGRIGMEVGAADGCLDLKQGGFALAATDMGHQDNDGSFGRNAAQREDFAHRAVHLTAVAAKRLIQRFYGRPQRFAYFSGCSDGGREALIEAQRHPEDFDGILAGAAALNFQVQNSLYHGWQARANTAPDGGAILTAARLPVLHQAVLKQCDALDGVVDGLISDPRLCKFDPATVACPGDGDAPGPECLSRREVDAARQLYEGPRDPQTGERLTAGGPQPGSELGWAGVFVPADAQSPIFSERIAMQALKHLVFETDPPADFKLADLRFDRATLDQLRARHPLMDATDPDLSRFAARGGKLVIWHGWSDPHISPLNSIAYHQAVRKRMGEGAARAFERLYLLPGVYHCSGGEGPSAIDLLTPMMAWVERGIAPDAVLTRTPEPRQRGNGFGQPEARPAPPMAGPSGPTVSGPPSGPPDGAPQEPPSGVLDLARSGPVVQRTRPVYPYPQVARYQGKGDIHSADSFRAVAGSDIPVPAWAGEDFFQPPPVRGLIKLSPDISHTASQPATR